jgi:pimeloyl-ACP methyl ester carboxylesterase
VTQVAGWLGAGVLTAGVSAALLAGAGAAHADTGEGSDAGARTPSTASDTPGKASAAKKAQVPAAKADTTPDVRQRADLPRTARRSAKPAITADREPSPAVEQTAKPTARVEPKAATVDITPSAETRTPATARVTPKTIAAQAAADVSVQAASAQSIPVIGDLLGPFQPDYPPLVRAVGSAVFNLIGAIVQTADGPPVVPPELRGSIEVSSSTLVISPGNEVAADWYFPTTGQPERLIYLQHGILASGPMYSYTAAYLAQRTNSVVVATTITSNPFADGGMWLGGDNEHAAVAQLFLDDDRSALNASLTTATLKAGRQNLTVPTEFVLVGHSLGGGFAPGVAGHYAEGLVARRAGGDEAPNELAGVVLLDAVPFSPILPNAMDRLKALEASNGGDAADYVPIYEIGAPLNFLNSTSAVNQDLSAARPGKFNGVVINGGVHMDGMLGGNPLIQAAAYLVAGIPQPQNPPAVQLLMAGWINDMFAGDIDPVTGRCVGDDCAGIYGEPGDTIVIPSGTDAGDASAVVIDSGSLLAVPRLPAVRFQPLEASSTGLAQRRQALIPLRVAI